jgi:hypothetical protein
MKIVLRFSRPTNDDVDVLKRELISVQQRMNELSLEKEQQIEPLQNVLTEMLEFSSNKNFGLPFFLNY